MKRTIRQRPSASIVWPSCMGFASATRRTMSDWKRVPISYPLARCWYFSSAIVSGPGLYLVCKPAMKRPCRVKKSWKTAGSTASLSSAEAFSLGFAANMRDISRSNSIKTRAMSCLSSEYVCSKLGEEWPCSTEASFHPRLKESFIDTFMP